MVDAYQFSSENMEFKEIEAQMKNLISKLAWRETSPEKTNAAVLWSFVPGISFQCLPRIAATFLKNTALPRDKVLPLCPIKKNSQFLAKDGK